MLQDIWTAIDEGRYAQAETELRGDPELVSTRAGQMALGYILAHTERTDEAREVFSRLRGAHRGDPWEHIAVHQLGRVERLAGQHHAALALYDEERELIGALAEPDPHKLAANAYETAVCHLALEDWPAARAALEQAVTFARDHDDPETLGRAERGLAELSVREGHQAAARLHLERAILAFQASEDQFAVREVEARLLELGR